ncbi:hypothetical protein OAK91_02910 [Planctomycetaceae bacterium]|nr:hypothetical protein [Planctomycetaceae bacterium]
MNDAVEISSTLDERIEASGYIERWPGIIDGLIFHATDGLRNAADSQEYFMGALEYIHALSLDYSSIIRDWLPDLIESQSDPFVNSGKLQAPTAHEVCLRLWFSVKTTISLNALGETAWIADESKFEPEWALSNWEKTKRNITRSVEDGSLRFDLESLVCRVKWERGRVVKEHKITSLEEVTPEKLVTKSDVAYALHIGRTSLKNFDGWPLPVVKAAGSRPAKYKLSELLPVLKRQCPDQNLSLDSFV